MVHTHRKITYAVYKTIGTLWYISVLKGFYSHKSNLSCGRTYIKSKNLPPWSLTSYSRATQAMKIRLIRSDRQQKLICAPVVNRHYLSRVSVGGRHMIDASKTDAWDRINGYHTAFDEQWNYSMTLIRLMVMVSHMLYLLCRKVRHRSKRLISLKIYCTAQKKIN